MLCRELITEHYAKNQWTDETLDAFYDLRDNPDTDYLPELFKMISENKGEDFVVNSLETLDYYRDEPKLKSEKITDLLKKLIADHEFSVESRKAAIIQFGYFGKWPDATLRKVIESDSPEDLKIMALRSILYQLKIPESVVSEEVNDFINNGSEISSNSIYSTVHRITQARADGKYDHPG